MYAIAGVSGHTGSVVADVLLARGESVRVIVRNKDKGTPWRARGAEVAVADFADTIALTAAFAGAKGAYVLLPPVPTSSDPIEDHGKLTTAIAAAVRAAAVPHVVLLSSIGAQHADGTGHIRSLHVAECELAATGAALTAVRAAYFHENWAAALGTFATGTIYSFLPNEPRFPQVATRDVGRTAAAALLEGPPRGTKQIIEVSGPADVSGADVAVALTNLQGLPVDVQVAPLEAVVPTFTRSGLSSAMAQLYREMYEGMIAGRVAWEGGVARAMRGIVGIEESLRRMLTR